MASQPPVSDQSPQLTTRILRELLTRPEKDGNTLKELSQLHHDVLRLGRDVACVPNRHGQEVLIPKMDLYESAFSNLLRVIDRMPQMKVIVPVLEDCWYGYQACCAQVFSSLSAEIHELKHQVDFFHEDLSDLQHLGDLCLSKMIEQDENYPSSSNSPEKIDQEQINAQIDDLEQQNLNLTEKVQRLAEEIDCLRHEKEDLEANISSLSAHVEDCEALNALQTPRPTTSLSDLVYILGDESTASLANEMASEVFEKHHNPIEFIERGMQYFDEGEEDDDFVVFREKYASIFECEYNSNDLSRAIIRRFGTTQEKFKILESSYIDLMRENHDLICQVAAFEEIEQKRSMARRRYQEKSQAEKKGIIQTYLDMLAEKGEDSWKDQLIGMGTGIEVPKLFRFGGKVRNKHMSKRETEKLVREVWKGRMAASSGVKSTTLVDFLGNHLQKKVGISAAVLELGYNFLYSLWKYQWDADCELFLKILMGDILEEVYVAQNGLLKDLEELFEALDKANGQATGHIRKEELRIALRSYFRVGALDGKSEDRFEEAMKNLDADHPDESIEWRKVFEEDREYNQGAFAECIRDQFLTERSERQDAIAVALYEECVDSDFCICDQLVTALLIAHPALGEKEAICIANNVFEKADDGSMSIVSALRYLSGGSLATTKQAYQQTDKDSKLSKSGSKTNRSQGTAKKQNNPLITSALEEVRQHWISTQNK